MSLATSVWFQQGAETLCSPSAILHGTEPVSALTHELLYSYALYIFFTWISSVIIWRWQGFNSEDEHPTSMVSVNMNIQLPWLTWNGTCARGTDTAKLNAWSHCGGGNLDQSIQHCFSRSPGRATSNEANKSTMWSAEWTITALRAVLRLAQMKIDILSQNAASRTRFF